MHKPVTYKEHKVLIPYQQGGLFRRYAAVKSFVANSLNPLSAGRSFQTLPLFFPFVKQRLTRLKYFKLCISKVAVLAHISQFCL